MPLFLGSGGHVRTDLPALVAALRLAHPEITLRLHPAIGEHASVVAAMARAAVEAAGFRNNRPSHESPSVQVRPRKRSRRDLNLTETAKALFRTSQPGVSKAILELEGELGVDIFARHGKRLRRITEPGREVVKAIEVIMREVGNLKRIGDEFSKQDAGTLSIATTHSQARYFLPVPIAQMRKRFPKVNISLHQGTPEQVAEDGLRGGRRLPSRDRVAG